MPAKTLSTKELNRVLAVVADGRHVATNTWRNWLREN